jgi:virulence-associated protein VagC
MAAAKRFACRRNSVLPGKEVRVRRIGHGVLLEPIDLPFDVKAWFDRIDAHLDEPFMAEGRQQPAMPSRRNIFDE